MPGEHLTACSVGPLPMGIAICTPWAGRSHHCLLSCCLWDAQRTPQVGGAVLGHYFFISSEQVCGDSCLCLQAGPCVLLQHDQIILLILVIILGWILGKITTWGMALGGKPVQFLMVQLRNYGPESIHVQPGDGSSYRGNLAVLGTGPEISDPPEEQSFPEQIYRAH